MSSSSTPNSERPAHLLSIGTQCSAPSCHLVDFLPITCQHCALPFCSEHFRPNGHACPKYDERTFDRVASPCPLCNSPIAIPPGEDPNVRMEKHLNAECSATTGKLPGKSTPECARAKCGKKLFAPIRCEKCKQQFCPQHRFPADHTCSTAASSKPSQSTSASSSTSAPKPSFALPTKASTAAAMAAVKRSLASTTSAATSPPAKPAPTSKLSSSSNPSTAPAIASTSNSNPFAKAKADRRAKAERESRRQALKARAAKGLLSVEEQAMLAAEEAQAQDRKGECVVV